MIAGLANLDHQNRILAEAASLVTLDQKFNRLVCLETTDKSAPNFHDTTRPLASFNMQRSDQDTETPSTLRRKKPCSRCGKTSHPGGSMN